MEKVLTPSFLYTFSSGPPRTYEPFPVAFNASVPSSFHMGGKGLRTLQCRPRSKILIKTPAKARVRDQDQISGCHLNLFKVRLKLKAPPADTVISGENRRDGAFC